MGEADCANQIVDAMLEIVRDHHPVFLQVDERERRGDLLTLETMPTRAAPIPLEWDVFFDLRGLELAFLNRYLRRLEPPRALALVLKELDEGFPISLDERSAPLTDWPPVDSVSDFVPILESVPEAIEAFLDRLLGKEPWSLKMVNGTAEEMLPKLVELEFWREWCSGRTGVPRTTRR